MTKCLLCESTDVSAFLEKEDPQLGKREYAKCNICQLIFLLPVYFLDEREEKSRYDLHQNSPEDEGYVNFLKRLTDPLLQKLELGMKGLDYGCGPGPTISHILGKRGFDVQNYDPIYFPDQDKLKRRYDFVTVTEVVEHFNSPREEYVRLNGLLKDEGGLLAVMTQMWDEEGRFKDWWYHREHTHVCFYHERTFMWIADWQGWKCEFPIKNVAIFSKSLRA